MQPHMIMHVCIWLEKIFDIIICQMCLHLDVLDVMLLMPVMIAAAADAAAAWVSCVYMQ